MFTNSIMWLTKTTQRIFKLAVLVLQHERKNGKLQICVGRERLIRPAVPTCPYDNHYLQASRNITSQPTGNPREELLCKLAD